MKKPGSSEKSPLIQASGEDGIESSPVRWYMLVVSCLIAFQQGCIWNTWSPISTSSEAVFGWSDGTIALLGNWACMCYILFFVPMAWVLAQGVRPSGLVGAGLCFIAAGVRCITTSNPTATYLIHFGQIINGIAGPVGMSIGPTLSSTWFPVHQRVTATALCAVFNYVGVSVSFILGPLLVRSGTDVTVDEMRHDILNFMYIELGFTTVVLLLTVVYFPNLPPSSPSVSASAEREPFIMGFRKLARNQSFWAASLAYGVLTGVFSGWSAYLLPNLKHFLPSDKAQNESGWMGFYANIAGCLAGVLMSRLADHLGGKMKLMLLTFCLVAVAFVAWFTLICIKVLPFSLLQLYISSIGAGLCINATMPLFFEAAIEVTYPISEGTSTAVLTTMNNIFCGIFLVMPSIKGLGDRWVNWTLCGACCVAFVLMMFFKETYRRLSVDCGAGSSQAYEVLA
eukprot:m.241508 g.241508  ORF g.241508 m.241508 type:complete len:454 (-) comp17446_c0_seq9:5225-6586(-)